MFEWLVNLFKGVREKNTDTLIETLNFVRPGTPAPVYSFKIYQGPSNADQIDGTFYEVLSNFIIKDFSSIPEEQAMFIEDYGNVVDYVTALNVGETTVRSFKEFVKLERGFSDDY